MKTIFSYFLLFLTPLVILRCSQIPIKNSDVTEPIQVTIIPSIHKLHFDLSWRYSISDLISTIEKTSPEMICVEISEIALGTQLEGLFPPEAALIVERFKNSKTSVIPADWRADRGRYTKASAEIEIQAQALQQNLLKKLENQQDRVSFLISPPGKALTRQIHELYVNNSGESADGFWLTRNSKIVDSCMRSAQSMKVKRVALVFGIDHFYSIEENLKNRYSVSIGKTEIVRSPQLDMIVNENIVRRWRANLENLNNTLISNNDDKNTVNWIAESKRIPELKLFIDSFAKYKAD